MKTKAKRKMPLITLEWLQSVNACVEGTDWFKSQKSKSLSVVITKLINEKHFDWANWTLTKIMTHKQNVLYACFCALQSINEFEKVYPNDNRPRQAIEAALKWAENPNAKNKKSAVWAAKSARAAAAAAESAELAAAESAAWKTFSAYGLKLILNKIEA